MPDGDAGPHTHTARGRANFAARRYYGADWWRASRLHGRYVYLCRAARQHHTRVHYGTDWW